MIRFASTLVFFLLGAAAVQAAPQAAGSQMIEVPVLARMIEKGETLSDEDFIVELRALNEGRGAIPVSSAVGMEVTRRLNAGAILRSSDVARAQMVRRGEPVNIVVAKGGLSITTTGRALSGGTLGAPVRVVSIVTNRTLEATVTGPGVVNLMTP
jgi:flagella basal body P-ring formation protein FlgA